MKNNNYDDIQNKLQSLFPNSEQRQTVLKAFADSIQKAEETSPGNWIVRERENDPVLKVRERVVFRISEGKIRLSLDYQTLEDREINPSEKFDRWETVQDERYPEYKNPPALNGYYTLLPEDEDWSDIKRLHFAYLDRLAEEGQNLRKDKQSHDPAIIEFLNEEVPEFHLKSSPLIPLDKADDLNTVINRYTNYIQNGGLEEETYKFDLILKNWGLPDLQADDFEGSIKQINFHNLLDWRASGAMKEFLKADPESYRQVLKNLFDESQSLEERLRNFRDEIKNLCEKNGLSFGNAGNDERTASVLLTFKYPEKYTLYKHRFYEHFCQFSEIAPQKTGQKYPHYLTLTQALLTNHLLPKTNLITAVKNYLGYNELGPAQKGLLAQDFLYQTFDKSSQPVKFNGEMNENSPSKNQILYGPPGTGKTYQTILKAAEIIEERPLKDINEAKQIFQANLQDRIEFITFHQNYTYEDFIQGLRPDTENNDELTFERRDGLFKQIADRALKNLRDEEDPANAKRPFDEVFNEFVNPLIEGEVEEIEVAMRRSSYFITAITEKSIDFRKPSGGTAHSLSIATLRKMYEAESTLAVKGLSSYYGPLLEKLLEIGKQQKANVEEQNYVIVIDEINRANISRVFGELITLIEPDKRSHGTLPMEAKLPSGESFMVPSNLYIIGTMNTADKSIALLDVALRRRFEFEPLYPKYELDDEEIHDSDILRKLNEQIIQTKGHDFQIGHTYFMGEESLNHRMNKKVIPLLLEYYMNDKDEVENLLKQAGLAVKENTWPLEIEGRNE